MSDEGKKVSFGFSKLLKKTNIIGTKKNVQEKEKIQFIDCLEEKSIRVINEEEKEDKLLVIPLKSNQVNDSNLNIDKHITNRITILEKVSLEKSSNTNISSPETLDSLAAKEILEEVSKTQVEEKPKIFAVPLIANAPHGEKESSLGDYEDVPVSEFGLAMLRGMGWCPGKGVGKNEKLVKSSAPVLRPKGMGLGADKVIKSAPSLSTNDNEELKLTKGAFVRIIAGLHKDSYGQVEGFDDESGRLFVKLSLKSAVVSFNEFMVQLVSKQEFIKNSKVINVKKYEEYKDKKSEIIMIDERLNRSPSVTSKRISNSSSTDNKPSSEIRIDSNNKKKGSIYKSHTKYSKNSGRYRSSSEDSLPRSKKDLSHSVDHDSREKIVYNLNSFDNSSTKKISSWSQEYASSKNKKLHKGQSSSDESLSNHRRNHNRSVAQHTNQDSSDESPSKQWRNHLKSKEHRKKYKKSSRDKNSSDESPPRRKRNHSQSKQGTLIYKQYSSYKHKRKSNSRSPRRK